MATRASSDMMTSSNGNIFRVTAHLCEEFAGHRWITRTKASDAEIWCYLWSAPVKYKRDIQQLKCVLTMKKIWEKKRNGGNWFSNPTPYLLNHECKEPRICPQLGLVSAGRMWLRIALRRRWMTVSNYQSIVLNCLFRLTTKVHQRSALLALC